jgi:hypothetical protein
MAMLGGSDVVYVILRGGGGMGRFVHHGWYMGGGICAQLKEGSKGVCVLLLLLL